MAEDTSVSIDILNRSYRIRCRPEEIEALRAAAYMVEQRMEQLYRGSVVVDDTRVAVLAAVNIAHDCLAQTEDASRRSRIWEKLEAALSR